MSAEAGHLHYVQWDGLPSTLSNYQEPSTPTELLSHDVLADVLGLVWIRDPVRHASTSTTRRVRILSIPVDTATPLELLLGWLSLSSCYWSPTRTRA